LITPSYLEYIVRCGARVSVPLLCTRCFHEKGPVPKRRGTIEWFDRRKRYGFISGEQGEEVFLHRNALYNANGNQPHKGQPVLYHVHYAIKGPEALNVELVEAEKPRDRSAEEHQHVSDR
jgi:CspA family cold shock protein